MSFKTTKELLEILLEGHSLTSGELDSVIADFEEGQYLEFKDGKITRQGERKVGGRVIRQYVSAFANAEGGTLVIGVSDNPREVSPCTAPGDATLKKWVDSILLDMAPFLVPSPRVQIVSHENGSVLVIAVARASQLVHCTEAGETQYFLRFHESTKRFPDYLLSDLLLGRRQQPILDLSVRPALDHLALVPGPIRSLAFYFSVENAGLVAAEQVQVGMIGWTLKQPSIPINKHLLTHLDVEEVSSDWQLKHLVVQPSGGELTFFLPPFARNTKALPTEKYIFPASSPMLQISAAAYVLAKAAAPIWFEFSFTYQSDGVSQDDWIQNCEIRRVIGRRPQVSVKAKGGSG